MSSHDEIRLHHMLMCWLCEAEGHHLIEILEQDDILMLDEEEEVDE